VRQSFQVVGGRDNHPGESLSASVT
jgi:hypothetical protein